ncbi:UV DNA damage repair endonuclease UvsE [Metabacillus idriensis]|uniref:UV DNA damage repair endonuclease UvsE n=1 Tax=Metabacillus idriensis TaxID=324768 RepID=UPI00174ACC4C|nr:UV DNA damage repair endonuclease UvsE [Metabacillus idriensis]
MTMVRLGYVAMSVNLKNCSPSQTMTFSQFQRIKDREAAIEKLERIARSNLENCLRILKHNDGHDVHFFRFSSRLIPLANHQEIQDFKYMRALKEPLKELGDWVSRTGMRVDFHPDHFVLLNSPKPEILNTSLRTLSMHEALLRGMNVPHEHRCVIHVGGAYNDKEKALEQFIHNWGFVPVKIQNMLMLENDDTTFTLQDTLYLCEKLAIPLVFDYHHHLAHHEDDSNWEKHWERVVSTWQHSSLPVKMHISSPRNEKEFRAHADYVNPELFMAFLNEIKGTVKQVDCMIEAKQKDDALFQLMESMCSYPNIEKIDGSSFYVR